MYEAFFLSLLHQLSPPAASLQTCCSSSVLRTTKFKLCVLVRQAKLVAICVMQAVAKCRVEDPPRSSLSPAGAAASSSAPHSPPTHQGFQPKALRVHTVTFNMAKQNPQELPEELVGRAGCPAGLKKYDVVAVGTQESGNLQVCVHSRVYRRCAVSQ